MSIERISIKGTSSGLIINIGSGVWQRLIEELDHSLAEKASFFKGGRVALNVGSRQLTQSQLKSVGQILKQHGVSLWAVEGDNTVTQEAAVQLGLETTLTATTAQPAVSPPPESVGDSIVIWRTIRSGQVVNHPGHVVVVGDVNPGAEIKAGGSVIVWGRLRGDVYAGAGIAGNANNGHGKRILICALQLSPMKLRIGDHIALAPSDDTGSEFVPEMASIQNGQIVAEPWHR